MYTFTLKKQSNDPQLHQAYLSLQPDLDANLDLTTMQSHFAAMYEAASGTVDAKCLQYYMTVLTDFALATASAKQDTPKKKKKPAPASRLSQWVRNMITRKRNVDPSDIKSSLASHPPRPSATDTSVSSGPTDAASSGDAEKPKQRKKSFSRALAKLGKKMRKMVEKNKRSSDGIFTRVSEEAPQDLNDGSNTAGCEKIKDTNQHQDKGPQSGIFFNNKYVSRLKLSFISERTEPSTGPSSLANVDRVVFFLKPVQRP